MRIIGCGDIHMSPANIVKIKDVSRADLIIINGDITNYGSRKDAKLILDEIMLTNTNILAQVGNLDNFEINDYLEELNLNLHAQARLFKSSICLVGMGGSNPTPFGTPTEFSEKKIFSLCEKAYQQGLEFISLAEPLGNKKIPTILVSHTPPHGTKTDILPNGEHVGSTSIRKIIEKYQPDLCITGHIHEATSIDKIGNTPIINPGMLNKGGYVNVTLDGTTINATLDFIETL